MDPRNPMTPSIHRQLMVAFSHSNRAMLARTHALGLKPGQPKVLEHLVAHEGCAQRDIARACAMDKSTVTSILSRMEEDGLIERRSAPWDHRTAIVSLTEAGRRAADEVLRFGDEVDALAWRGLSDEERDELAALLGRVIGNLDGRETEST